MTTYRGTRPRRVPTWLILACDVALLIGIIAMSGLLGDVGAAIARLR